MHSIRTTYTRYLITYFVLRSSMAMDEGWPAGIVLYILQRGPERLLHVKA